MNLNGTIDAMNAPEYGSRRRSSMMAAQVLEAIRETDEEIYEETLQYDLVALGGGVATGYWGEVIFFTRGKPTLCRSIISVQLRVENTCRGVFYTRLYLIVSVRIVFIYQSYVHHGNDEFWVRDGQCPEWDLKPEEKTVNASAAKP